MAFEFGNCPCGGGPYTQREVEVRRTTGGQQLLIDGILQGVCTKCASRIYKLDTLRRIEAAMRGDRKDPVGARPVR